MVARSIVFHNTSAEKGHLALFSSLPHVHCEDGGPMRTPAWIVRAVGDNTVEHIEIDDRPFAWHSTQAVILEPGSVIGGGTTVPVTLGRRTGKGRQSKVVPGSAFATRNRRYASSALVPLDDQGGEGQFQILAQEAPVRQELIGLALRDDRGRLVPVMAMKATPGFSYGLEPFPAYHLAFVRHHIQPGQIVDLRSLRTKVLVDFSSDAAANCPMADITLSSDGKLALHFKTPPPPPELELEPTLDMTAGFGLVRHKHGRWRGSVAYPSTTSTTAVIQGIGAMVDSLSSKYAWSVTTSQTRSGGVATTVYFWPRDGVELQDHETYQAAWRAAVAASRVRPSEADGEDDGQTDLGCFPGTPGGSFTRLAVVSR